MRKEKQALLDRLLIVRGVAPIGTVEVGGPKVVPRSKTIHPWRRNAAIEASAWSSFNEAFPDGPSSEEIAAERARTK